MVQFYQSQILKVAQFFGYRSFMFSLNNICENENKIEYMSKYVNKIEPNGKQFLTLKYD